MELRGSKTEKNLKAAFARELQVAIQYMWQHVQWGGVKGLPSRAS